MNTFQYGDTEIGHLKSRDKKLAVVIDAIGHIERAVNPDLFVALVDSIVGQQISAKAAVTVGNRLHALCDGDYENLNTLSLEDIQKCGMSTRKAGYIKGVAEAAATGAIDFAALATQADEEIIKTLTALPGVGVWTVEMLLIFSLQRPNIVSLTWPFGAA